MVIPFGFGAGDGLAVTKLAAKVISELRQNGEAPAKYQSLIIELETLGRALTRLYDIKPTEHELKHLEAIRAAAAACARPLTTFLENISKFDKTLGSWDAKEKRFRGVGRRIQFEVALDEEVKELRTILASHMLMINTLLSTQLLECITVAETDRASLNGIESESSKMVLEKESANQVHLEEVLRVQKSTEVHLATQTDALDTLQAKAERSEVSHSQHRAMLEQQAETVKDIEAYISEFKKKLDVGPVHHTGPGNRQPSKAETSSPILDMMSKLLLIFASGTAVASMHALVTQARELSSLSKQLASRMMDETEEVPPNGAETCIATKYSSSTLAATEKDHRPNANKIHSISEVRYYSVFEALKLIGFKGKARSVLRSKRTKPPHDFGFQLSAPRPQPNIPRKLSFIFQVESLRPNYQNQPIHYTKSRALLPPDVKDGFSTGSRTLWNWFGGRATPVTADDPIFTANLTKYQTATLFSQYPSTPYLLVVPFDARKKNVSDYNTGWESIRFGHTKLSHTEDDWEFYSSISSLGQESSVAAPGQSFWMSQLLHGRYNYQAEPNARPRKHAGLIGNLPILLALAVFSAPEAHLREAISSLQPGARRPHKHQYPSGYTPERGAVITVYLDPRNPEQSTTGLLDKLQNGDFGPFYGRYPAPPALPAAAPES